MVNHRRLDDTFVALADPIRRAVLATLTRGEVSVSALAAPHAISLPAFLKHLHILERAGLVSAVKTGRVRHCRLVAAPLKRATRWLEDYRVFWEGQLDALERYLRTDQEKPSWTPLSSPPLPPSRSAGPSRPRRNGSSRRGSTRRR